MLIPFSPPAGFNSDDTTFSAEGRWADGSNVRFRNGRPETLGRIVQILGAGSLAVFPRTIFAQSTGSTPTPRVVVGTTDALYAGTTTALADITPVGMTSAINSWALDAWGDNLLAAPSGSLLYEYSGAGVATEVVNAPDKMNHMLVTEQRQVMALGCNEETSGAFNPMCIRWCDFEDYTDWTTSSGNNAGEHILEGEGKIVGGRRVGSYIAIWTNAGLYMGQFIGDPGQTYRFERVASGCGLVASGASAVGNDGLVYWMTPDHNFFRWQPGAPPEQLACPILKFIRSDIQTASSADRRTNCANNSLYGEIWWSYLATDATYHWVSFSTQGQGWAKGTLDYGAICNANFLYYAGASAATYRTWRPFLGVTNAGEVFANDVEDSGGGTAEVIAWSIESTDFYLNESAKRMMIRGVIPDFEDQVGDLSLTLYMRDRPQSFAVTKGPYALTTAATKKDLRASGKIATVKFSGGDVGYSYARLGKPLFDIVQMGDR